MNSNAFRGVLIESGYRFNLHSQDKGRTAC